MYIYIYGKRTFFEYYAVYNLLLSPKYLFFSRLAFDNIKENLLIECLC